jgi:arsenate reductase
MSIVIHHNPDCGTSRNVLEMIKASGETPTIIEYLKEGWTKAQLLALFASADITVCVSDETLLNAMIEHPVLVNRPIVCSPKGVRLCRPSEKVLPLLSSEVSQFTKEDGEIVK